MKKFLISSLTVMTVVWAMGLAAIVAVPAQAAVGDLVKSASSNTVYVVTSDGVTICQLPHANVYTSWGYPADFSTVMTKDLSSYTVGSNVEFRDASLVKGDGSAVYMVYNNMKRPIVSDVVFLALGYDWDDITWLSDAFLADYTDGAVVDDSSVHPDGQLVKYASDPAIYLIDGGVKRAFQSASAFEDNRYAWGDVITIPDTETYADGAPVAGYEAALSLPVCIGTTVTVPGGSGLTVALAPTTAAAASIIADSTNGGQALVPFTTINFTASSDGDVVVKTLMLKRTGISSDSSLDNLYLYDGMMKLTDGGSLSGGYVTFNNANGLFTVPAGTTLSVTVKGDVAMATSAGQTIGFSLESASDVTTDGAAVSGSFPAAGNVMTVANVSDFGKMQVSVTSVAGTNPDPNTTDVNIFKANFIAANQKMQVEYLKFTSLGSIQPADLENFKLYDGGTLVATVAALTADRELIFDLTGSPITFTNGQTKNLRVFADVVSGSTRTYDFTLQEATDVVVRDNNYSVYVMAYPTTVGSWSVISGGSSTIGSGSLSVIKSTDAPTSNVALDATNVLVGKWDLKATGEDMKVKNFDVQANTSGGGLDNGKVFFNGVQVGSTKDLTEATDVNFTFGSSLIVPAGTTGNLEAYSDIKKANSTSFSNGNTLAVSIGAGSSNVQRVSSLSYVSAPGSDVAANTLTISSGALSVNEYAGYGDQTMVAGTTNAKVASAVLSAGTAEGVGVSSLTVTLSADEAASTTDMLLMKDGVQIGTTKVDPSTSNIFTVNFDIPSSGSAVVDVYANFETNADAGPWTAAIEADGNGLVTSNSVTGGSTSDNMQTITLATGSLTAAIDASTPDADIVLAGTTKQLMTAVAFTSQYEAFEIQELTVISSAAMGDSLTKIYLEYPTETGTGQAEGYLVGNSVTFTGLNMYVPRDESAVLNIYSDVGTTTAGADSGDEGSLDFDVSATYKHIGKGSGTTETTGTNVSATDVAGNDMVVRKTKPTITVQSLGTSTLESGTNKPMAKFTVSADAKGSVAWSRIGFDVSLFDADGGGELYYYSPTLYNSSDSALSASSSPTSTSATNVDLTSQEKVSAGTSKSYTLKINVSGAEENDSLSFSIKSPYTTTATGDWNTVAANENAFVWADYSQTSHDASGFAATDWCNAEFVDTLPSDSWTLTR